MFAPRTLEQSRADVSAGHVRNGRTTRTVWNVLEGRHIRRSRLCYRTKLGTNAALVTLYRISSRSDTYRCLPGAHASRTGRTRALTTWAMADPRVLCETCMDLAITSYLQPSLAAADSPRMVNVFSSLRPAKLQSSRGMLYSAGHGARGAGTLIGAGRTPERACGTLGRSPRHGPGVFAGRFARQFRCGRFVSCHGVGAEYFRCLR